MRNLVIILFIMVSFYTRSWSKQFDHSSLINNDIVNYKNSALKSLQLIKIENAAFNSSQNLTSKGIIILVHGLFVHSFAMTYMRLTLEQQGYEVHAFSYYSIYRSSYKNAADLVVYTRKVSQHNFTHLPVHFVGHSLGGLMIRKAYLVAPELFTGRIVTLGTPHQSSAIANYLQNYSLPKFWLKNSYLYALDGNISTWKGEIDLGSIAGDRSSGLGKLMGIFSGENDGVVSVAETKLPMMKDHLILHKTHLSLKFSRQVCLAIDSFLQKGYF